MYTDSQRPRNISYHADNHSSNNINITPTQLKMTLAPFFSNATNATLMIRDYESWRFILRTDQKFGFIKNSKYNIENFTNYEEKLKYVTFQENYLKFFIIDKWLRLNPFIYDAQFKHFFEDENYLNMMFHQSTLNVLFIDFQLIHATHLSPARKMEKFAVDMIINMEAHFDKIIEIGIKYKDRMKCIIFRPPNPICKEKYDGNWIKLSKIYEDIIPNLNETGLRNITQLKGCLRDNKLKWNETYGYYGDRNISIRGIDICAKYTLTQVGVKEIEKRMKSYVYKRQNEIYKEYQLKLIYLDYVTLFKDKCNLTKDGRHYPQLLPVQSMVLFNIIQKWC